MRIGGGVLPASIQQHTDGADFDLTEGGVTVHVHHAGERARAVQGLRAGRRRRALERARLDHVRLDAPVDQARRRLQRRPRPRRSAPPTPSAAATEPMRAQLGYGLLTIGTVAAALGLATLATGLATGRRALLDVGRRYVVVILVVGDRRVRRHGDGAVRARLLDQVRRRQRRARNARALHVHRGVGARSKARSCCGRCCSRSTSRSPRGDSATVPTTRSSRGPRSCSTWCCSSSSR